MNQPSDMEKFAKAATRFAEVWVAEITKKFKPFNEAVARMQENERKRRSG